MAWGITTKRPSRAAKTGSVLNRFCSPAGSPEAPIHQDAKWRRRFLLGCRTRVKYLPSMKSARSILVILSVCATSMVYAAVPPVNVTVSDAGGKAAFKGMTNAKGVFATAKLTPGNYTVQFATQSGDMKGKHFAIVVGAGSKKVSAAAVPGEKFARGGVALKVDVGSGLNITGQVSAEERVTKSGKKQVWIPPMLGSNLPGRWVDEDSADAAASKSRGKLSSDQVSKMQDNSSSPQGN